MKKSISLLFSIFLTIVTIAAVPQKISYQAVVRNTSNALVVNSNIGMQISILQSSATGTAVYVERQFPATNANGLISIEIGTGTVISGTFSTIDWSAGTYFIKSEYDLNGGANYSISGISQMLSVPYAMYAQTAGNASAGSFADLTSKPTTLSGYGITDGVNTTGAQTIAGNKTFTGTISAGSKAITNVATPTNTTDAANKAYVDGQKNKIFATGDNTASLTFVIPDNADIFYSKEGYWNANVILPTPTASNDYLFNRIGSTIVLKCESSFAFAVKIDNTDLSQILNVQNGNSVIFIFDGKKWRRII